VHGPQTPVVVSQAGAEPGQSPLLQQWVALQPPSVAAVHAPDPARQLWPAGHCVLFWQGPHPAG
jgi:hypothetical protein